MMTEDLLFVLEHSSGALAFWRDIVRVRAEAQDFLVFGRLLRPPQPTGPALKMVPMCGNKPLVQHHATILSLAVQCCCLPLPDDENLKLPGAFPLLPGGCGGRQRLPITQRFHRADRTRSVPQV
jgi:hypothetical protein